MIYQYSEPALDAYFAVSTDFIQDQRGLNQIYDLIHIHWNRAGRKIPLRIDGVSYELLPGQITTSTFAQDVVFGDAESALTSFSFNREFYCINDHDHEVSCNGLIFFGTSAQPLVLPDEEEQRKLELLLEVFLDEYQTKDRKQGEMLRILLKRLIIKVTRLVKSQLIGEIEDDNQIDLLRKFNLLVEEHFKTKKMVSDYAALLFKSPKTLSNLFAKLNQKTPLQIIHERVILEAKRQLIYTAKSGKEIAYDLGFEDTGTFHKLFKKLTEKTPQQFKAQLKG